MSKTAAQFKERLREITNQINANRRVILPVSSVVSFIVVGVVTGLVLYFSMPDKYNINGEIAWQPLLWHSVLAGGLVSLALNLGYYAYRKFF
jgi:hypothetical protein